MKRKIVKMGRSYYIVIPKSLVTRKMIENGVEQKIISYSGERIVMSLVVLDGNGEHDKNNKENRENAQKLRDTHSIL